MHSLEGSPKLLLRNSSCGEPDEDVKELKMCCSYPSASTWHRVERPSPKVFLGKIFKKSFPTGTRFHEEADRNVCLGKKGLPQRYVVAFFMRMICIHDLGTAPKPPSRHSYSGIPMGDATVGRAKNVAKISLRNGEGRAKQIVYGDHII